ncbi:unnamed protein product [Calicophoron daubneyi]|uniref:Zinc transporter ZIP8 n=1 Tax=Calicophoron daubneyi TaxID=300641 RepID=A0AAV2TH63_CALDB
MPDVDFGLKNKRLDTLPNSKCGHGMAAIEGLVLQPCEWNHPGMFVLLQTELGELVAVGYGLNESTGDSYEAPLPNSNVTGLLHPSLGQAIGFGFIATTIINVAAAGGLLFQPLKKYKIYPAVVSFMVATAVGSLFTNALLVLLPEALGLTAVRPSGTYAEQYWYVPISVAACGGTFAFFVLEFALTRLRLTLERRHTKESKNDHRPASAGARTNGGASLQLNLDLLSNNMGEPKSGIDSADVNTLPLSVVHDNVEKYAVLRSGGSVSEFRAERISFSIHHQGSKECIYNELSPTFTFQTPNLCTKLGSVEPVVWMVIIGDGVHNFMDGLSIGASFAHSIRLGISLSLAVLCEELPHELGDLAILLRSGMSVSLAVFFNLTSACTAYAGFFVGIFVGELSSAAAYIFAITAGFFLYISLADMLAEMHRTEEMLGDDDKQMFILFLVHCGGILFGFSCILTITLTSGFISI